MSQIIINGQPLYQVDLPEMTLAEYLALPAAERPKEWIRTDAEYTDIPAENVELSDGTSVQDALDDMTSGTLIYPVVFATSQVGNRYYAALPTLPKNKTATLSKVNVLGIGDVSVSNYTLAYDPNTGYAFMFSTSNTDWSGKAVHAYIDFT